MFREIWRNGDGAPCAETQSMCHSWFFWVLTALVSSACGGSTFDDVTGTVGGSAGTSGDVGTGGLGQGGLNGTGGGAPSGGAGGLASTRGRLGVFDLSLGLKRGYRDYLLI
jgi:hypothetical protein